MSLLILEKVRPKLDSIERLVLTGVGAGVSTAVIALLWIPFSFVMDEELLRFLFRPLIIGAPLLGGAVGLLLAFDYSWLTTFPEAHNVMEADEPDFKRHTANVALWPSQ